MKLLFDQNLSFRLVSILEDIFPDSTQARLAGLDKADDGIIWQKALQEGYVIVTQDADFEARSRILGFPPKIIWLTCGNTSTDNVATLLRAHYENIKAFEINSQAGCLEIY